MEFRRAGPLRVHIVSDATLPDPGHHPRIIRIAHEVWRAGTGVTTRIDDVDRFVLIRAGRGVVGHLEEPPPVTRPREPRRGRRPPSEQTVAGTAAAVLAAAGTRLRLHAGDDEHLTIIIVTARTPGFRRRLLSHGGPTPAVRSLRSFAEAEALLDCCLRHAAAGDELEQRTATAYFQTFLALLSAEISGPPAPGRGRVREATYHRARELVAARALELGGAADAASQLGRSTDYVNRLFRQYAGETLGGFLRRQKMSRAADWLRHGEATIEEIAERLGYADRFAFSKAFSRHFGVTPGRWQRS
ncbi:MAG: helix-turn-helix transcriptional regulator [Spirochaetota bacterium]